MLAVAHFYRLTTGCMTKRRLVSSNFKRLVFTVFASEEIQFVNIKDFLVPHITFDWTTTNCLFHSKPHLEQSFHLQRAHRPFHSMIKQNEKKTEMPHNIFTQKGFMGKKCLSICVILILLKWIERTTKLCSLLKPISVATYVNGWIEGIKSNIDCTHFSGFFYHFFHFIYIFSGLY